MDSNTWLRFWANPIQDGHYPNCLEKTQNGYNSVSLYIFSFLWMNIVVAVNQSHTLSMTSHINTQDHNAILIYVCISLRIAIALDKHENIT